MKTTINLILIAAFGLLLGSCDLERMPYNEISADKLDAGSIESVTLGTYAKLKEEAYNKIIHQVGEYGGDNISLSGSTSDMLFNIYTYRRTANNTYAANMWLYTYQMAVNCNSMIELIPEGESPEKDQLLGENYFLRGFVYFQLCNIYGRPYAQSPETNLGVPLKLTTDITEFPPRATVKQVYEQVVADMLKAAELMNENKTNIYASKEVAYAFLSRIYLYMQDWAKAKEYADLVIASGRYTLLEGSTYQSYTHAVPEDNTETIFAIRNLKDVDLEKYNMEWYSPGSLYAEINEIGWGEMYPSYSYLQLIAQNPGDLRHAFFANQAPADGAYTWLLYVNPTPMYVTRKVELAAGQYTIVEGADNYTSPQVEETGGKYYVTEKTGNLRYEVKIEAAANLRNGYPKRFIYKCSLQEEQSHLYSPVMIRLAEIYLNRAEANDHLGSLAEATADLNIIRRRAAIPERTLGGESDETVLNWILEERRLELAWEGHRKYDVFRNGLTLDREYPGTHLSGSPVYKTVAPTADIVVELIPQRELDAYPIPLDVNP
ncbi:MAG: RagB/SusD family nutrient uptake outer membrane protein [Prevotellaceae bacterium]|jgi:hypothetical protein|nr:RagB/SusD family nutrient uptake outer membrane protein [Prevotellaceae bacterium]